jgi:hypothetical protein
MARRVGAACNQPALAVAPWCFAASMRRLFNSYDSLLQAAYIVCRDPLSGALDAVHAGK